MVKEGKGGGKKKKEKHATHVPKEYKFDNVIK